jgi:hypothetical protein
MRQLGAQSLRELCELDLSQLGPQCANRAVRLFTCGLIVISLVLHDSARCWECPILAMSMVVS